MNAMPHASFEALSSFRLNGTAPFQTDPEDLASSSLGEAHALLLVMGNLLSETEPDEMNVAPKHLGTALEGIRTLISLAAWASEQEAR